MARRLGTAIPGRRSFGSAKSFEHSLFFQVQPGKSRLQRCRKYDQTDRLFLIGVPHETEDLIQETYLEAWKSFHRFELGTNCRAWLFKIMFHRLHHVRRRLLKASRVITIDAREGQDELAAEPDVPQEIRDEDVLNALEKVAVEFREIVLLADVEEFSYKEIAETLKIPLGTVMSRLSQGRKLLRQELAEVARSYGINPRTKQAGAAETA